MKMANLFHFGFTCTSSARSMDNDGEASETVQLELEINTNVPENPPAAKKLKRSFQSKVAMVRTRRHKRCNILSNL